MRGKPSVIGYAHINKLQISIMCEWILNCRWSYNGNNERQKSCKPNLPFAKRLLCLMFFCTIFYSLNVLWIFFSPNKASMFIMLLFSFERNRYFLYYSNQWHQKHVWLTIMYPSKQWEKQQAHQLWKKVKRTHRNSFNSALTMREIAFCYEISN